MLITIIFIKKLMTKLCSFEWSYTMYVNLVLRKGAAVCWFFFFNFRKIEPTTHTNNWVMKNINKCHNRSTQTVETVMALIMFLQVPQTSSNLYYVNVSVTNIF